VEPIGPLDQPSVLWGTRDARSAPRAGRSRSVHAWREVFGLAARRAGRRRLPERPVVRHERLRGHPVRRRHGDRPRRLRTSVKPRSANSGPISGTTGARP